MEWTQAEINLAESYYHGSDKESEAERWEHVSDMMFCADYSPRTPNAYRTKLHRVWRDRQEQKKFIKQ